MPRDPWPGKAVTGYVREDLDHKPWDASFQPKPGAKLFTARPRPLEDSGWKVQFEGRWYPLRGGIHVPFSILLDRPLSP